MADLSLNLDIKGIGTTKMSMDDAKKLYGELKVLFEEKVKYVPSGGWHWAYPWWGYAYNQNGIYGTSYATNTSHLKGTSQRGLSGSDTSGESAYNISI